MSVIKFLERPFPSANMIAIGSRNPVVIDTGFGSDVGQLDQLLISVGVEPASVALIVNTHHHSDHVGGNHYMQSRYGTHIAAHRWEAELANRKDPNAFMSDYLDQPVEPFSVSRKLSDDDVLRAHDVSLRVIHTPGHTLGHIALYVEEELTVVCGDTLYAGDVGWLNIFREGVSALERSLESLEKLAALKVRRALPGHGGELNFAETLEAARRRYSSWLHDPEKVAWHGCKRIFAFALMIRGGLSRLQVRDYLTARPWLQDFAKYVFRAEPDVIAEELMRQLLQSGAVAWKEDVLVACTPHNRPANTWIEHFLPRAETLTTT